VNGVDLLYSMLNISWIEKSFGMEFIFRGIMFTQGRGHYQLASNGCASCFERHGVLFLITRSREQKRRKCYHSLSSLWSNSILFRIQLVNFHDQLDRLVSVCDGHSSKWYYKARFMRFTSRVS